MTDAPMGVYRNMRDEQKKALFDANKAWSKCVSENFIGKWLSKETNESIEDVCVDELSSMRELNEGLYEEKPIPFKTEV